MKKITQIILKDFKKKDLGKLTDNECGGVNTGRLYFTNLIYKYGIIL